MDKFIHYVNKDGRVNALYSSPEEYVKVKHDLNRTWPLKTDDFFPYADAPTSYWTGMFPWQRLFQMQLNYVLITDADAISVY